MSNKTIKGSVLFCDIRNFTKICNDNTPQESFNLIEDFLNNMSKEIEKFQGVISNLTGDGFVAIFKGENNCNRSLDCAISLRNKIMELNKKNHENNTIYYNIGVGIDTGYFSVGDIKLDNFKTQLIIGDVVNRACRIESLTKQLFVDILVSKRVKEESSHNFLKMPSMQIKGEDEKIEVFWLAPNNRRNLV